MKKTAIKIRKFSMFVNFLAVTEWVGQLVAEIRLFNIENLGELHKSRLRQEIFKQRWLLM